MTACDGMNKPAEPQAPILTGEVPGLRQKDTHFGDPVAHRFDYGISGVS